MKDELIVVRPFQFVDYLEISGYQCIGEHGTYRIRGHISLEKEQEYLSLIMGENTWVHVDAVTYERDVKRIFKGFIRNADIEKTGETCILTLELVTGSYLMDTNKHIRSFQDAGISYDVVLDTITGQYANREYEMTVGKEDVITDFLLQYNETDWEFAKRIASHFGSYIYPDIVYEGTKIYMGEPEISVSAKVNVNEYAVERRDSETNYIVKLRELFYVGDWLEFNGKLVWISEVITTLIGNELYHTYRLVQEKGIKVNKKYNERCVGAALIGIVTAVEKDKVQIEMVKDENKEKSGKRWFTYATPYSTPDGTGWYCMPEIGDCIRLRVPSSHEAEAYVINSVHLSPVDGTERQNPDNKSIMNKQGKEILFTPNSLVMTNNAGMSIEILDEEGIKITSDKGININAAEGIEIVSMTSKLGLYAQENIILKQGNITMSLDGEMRMQGARLNLN